MKLNRLLVVGLGSIGRRHARLARGALPDVEIVAWSRRLPETPEPLVDRTVTTLEEAFEVAPDAAVIANPSTLHLEAAIPLARAGVHLLVEKPLAASPAGVRELLDIARERRLALMTGYNLRFLPSLRLLRDSVREGAIGRVLSVRAEVGSYLPSWRPWRDYRETVSASARLGGGVLLELSHEIDYLRWMFGEVESVNATLFRHSSLEIDVEDTAHLLLTFAPEHGNPAVAASVTLDFIRHDVTRCCTVIGDRTSIRWDGIADTVHIYDTPARTWRLLFQGAKDPDETYVAEWRDFLQAIDGRQAPAIAGEDGLAVLHVIEAARRSQVCAV